MAVVTEYKYRKNFDIVRLSIYTLIFILFLIPISGTAFGSSGVSVNYAFMLFPLICLSFKKIIINNNFLVLMGLILYSIIFFASVIFYPDLSMHFERKFISFIIFMSLFSFAFVKIDQTMLVAFKTSIVCISLYFSLSQIFQYSNMNLANLGSAGKSIVGWQRYGFIYLFAYWVLIFYRPSSRLLVLFKFIFVFIIVAGLFMTFSRSSILALLVSNFLYFFKGLNIKKFLYKSTYKRLTVTLCGILLTTISLYIFFPSTITFHYERFLQLISLDFELDNSASSEGYRVHLLNEIFTFVAGHPFTGSGFLGTWILSDNLIGSAHNQYSDVLFRTGIFGFLFYIFLNISIIKNLKREEESLLWGFLATVVFGMFHETFKLSQGAFVLAFLYGYTVNQKSKSM